MTGAVEAVGEAASGAAWARAIEPGAGGANHEAAGGACLNCGMRLIGRYCHACGQSAHVHRTMASVGHDLAHGLFHFEGKIWRTLPMLALRPGALTRRYIAGERARFVSPLALFLFGVLLMFAAIEALGPPLRPHAQVSHNGRILTSADLQAEIADARTKVARLQQERRPATGATAAALDRQLESAVTDLHGLLSAERVVRGVEHPTAIAGSVHTGWGSLDARIAAARADPALALVQIEANAHKFAWALIPISLPFLWAMFFWRREYRIYDHLVFITYSLAAVMLLLVGMAALGATGASTDWVLFLVPVHFFLQLRGAYRLGWWGAAWRTAGLMFGATCSLMLFGAIVLWLGTAG